MFRCVSELKGLIIDADKFKGISFDDLLSLFDDYKCVFITYDEKYGRILKHQYIKAKICCFPNHMRMFSPNISTHNKCLDIIGLKSSEVAYVSSDINFIENSLCFLSGTIWISNEMDYERAGVSPDLICGDINNLFFRLNKHIYGYWGEASINPLTDNKGIIVFSDLEVYDETVKVCILGRYFGYSHYMNQLHPYSSSIFLNKKKGKAYGLFNNDFYNLFHEGVNQINHRMVINGICAVPSRPSQCNRFEGIVSNLANSFNIENINQNFICVKDYPIQKNKSLSERIENVKDVFCVKKDLNGTNIVLIDDVITTGSTIRECVKTLKKFGAGDVVILVLAVNQYKGNYWSAVLPEVKCKNCGSKMKLLVNSKDKKFFYSCCDNSCRSTRSYEDGRMELIDYINRR